MKCSTSYTTRSIATRNCWYSQGTQNSPVYASIASSVCTGRGAQCSQQTQDTHTHTLVSSLCYHMHLMPALAKYRVHTQTQTLNCHVLWLLVVPH